MTIDDDYRKLTSELKAASTPSPKPFDSLSVVRPRIEYKFWAQPGHGQSLDELARQMDAVGNVILEVDRPNNQVLIGKVSRDLWGCRFCLDRGSVVILDSERELEEHAAEVHGWRP